MGWGKNSSLGFVAWPPSWIYRERRNPDEPNPDGFSATTGILPASAHMATDRIDGTGWLRARVVDRRMPMIDV